MYALVNFFVSKFGLMKYSKVYFIFSWAKFIVHITHILAKTDLRFYETKIRSLCDNVICTDDDDAP